MFDIGFWELIVVGLVMLFVIGPEHLPAVSRVLGRRLHGIKNSFQKLKTEVLSELNTKPTDKNN